VALAIPPETSEPPLRAARGVYAVDPVLDANLVPSIRAEREPSPALRKGEAALAVPPMSGAERSRRLAGYRDYLTASGGTLFRDSLPREAGVSEENDVGQTIPRVEPAARNAGVPAYPDLK
jgi:hypothetical protein